MQVTCAKRHIPQQSRIENFVPWLKSLRLKRMDLFELQSNATMIFLILFLAVSDASGNPASALDVNFSAQELPNMIHRLEVFDSTTTTTVQLVVLQEGALSKAWEARFVETFSSVLGQLDEYSIYEYRQSSWLRPKAELMNMKHRTIKSGALTPFCGQTIPNCNFRPSARDGDWVWYLVRGDGQVIHAFLLHNRSCSELPGNCPLRILWENAVD